MSQQQQNAAQSVHIQTQIDAGRIASAHRQTNLAVDLIILDAGLRLKVLPLRDAMIRGRKLGLGETERHERRSALFALSGGSARLNIVDIGLFADAVARRPDVAERLWRALRSPAHR